jgi:hypothetical protein
MAGSLGGEFRTALRTKSFRLAMDLARSMPRVSLSDALALTMLAAEQAPERFPALARRFLVRFIAEAEPTLEQVKKVADALDSLGLTGDLPALREGAERALEDLGRQLRRK